MAQGGKLASDNGSHKAGTGIGIDHGRDALDPMAHKAVMPAGGDNFRELNPALDKLRLEVEAEADPSVARDIEVMCFIHGRGTPRKEFS